MNILLPTQITDSMIMSGTNIPEIDTSMGEVAWVSGTNYPLGTRRVYAGYTYEAVQEISGSPQNTYPPNNVLSRALWLKDEGAPSNRMAPFDEYIYTSAKRNQEVRYVLRPGFFNGFVMYGVEADRVEVTLKDESGGTILYHNNQEMWEQAFGEWEYLFGNLQKETKYTKVGLPMRPMAELDVKLIRNNPDVLAELGFLSVGQWQTLVAPLTNVGGTQYGVEVTPKSYSYFRRNDDGTYTRRKGRTAKVINASVMIDASDAPRAAMLLDKILDTPVAVEASNLPKYGHISTVGFVTGTVVAESWGVARVNLKVDGNV